MAKENVRPSEVRKQIGARKLMGLLKDAAALKQDVSELTGTFGNAIKDAAENHHLNKRAFRICAGLYSLEPEKLADTLDALDFYLDASGLRERAASAPRMEMPERDETNVADFPEQTSVEA